MTNTESTNFSTRNGDYGFEVTMADGRKVTELQKTWDEVHDGVSVLKILHLRTGVELASIKAAGFTKIFFFNEALGSMMTQKTMLAGKVFGGVRADGTVVEGRLSFEKPGLPKMHSRSYSLEQFTQDPGCLRLAAV